MPTSHSAHHILVSTCSVVHSVIFLSIERLRPLSYHQVYLLWIPCYMQLRYAKTGTSLDICILMKIFFPEGSFQLRPNTAVPGRSGMDIEILHVGTKGSKKTFLAVTNHERTTVGGHTNIIKVSM